SREDVIPKQSTGLKELVKTSQEELIKKYEERYLEDYRNKISTLQTKLLAKRQELMDELEPPVDSDDDGPSDQGNENPEEIGINLDEETNELSKISIEMNELADQLGEPETPPSTEDGEQGENGENPAQPDTSSKNSSQDDLKALSTRLDEVKKKIQEKAAAHNDELKDKVSQMSKELESLTKKVDKLEKMILWLQDRYNVIPNEIKNQESSIVSKIKELKRRNSPISNAFSDHLFEKKFETKSTRTKKLMDYSNQLSQLELMIANVYQPSNNSSLYDAKEENIQSILSIKKEETENWDKLKNQMLTSNDDVSTFIDEMQ
ncbi:type VII secretion protein EsaA, partial [Bacillus safensis]